MTNPTTSAVPTTILKSSPAAPEQRANGGIHHSPTASPREILSSQEIAERMRQSKEPISLGIEDQDEIRKACSLTREGTLFPWSLNGFLKHLVSYISSKAIEGTVELIQGTFSLVGKSFWQKTLGKKIDDQLITSEMWNFCTESPKCFEVGITLPLSYESDKDQLDRFKKLIIYFFAAEAMPPLEFNNHGAALGEFGRLMNFVPPKEPVNQEQLQMFTRLSQLKQVFDRVEANTKFAKGGAALKRFESLEIACPEGTSLRVFFGFLRFTYGSPDDFRLELSPDYTKTLAFELICPLQPWAVLHTQLLSRPTPSQLLGRFWADLTLKGATAQLPELKNCERQEAFISGLRHLPPENDALLAYYCNVVSFQRGIQGLPPRVLNNHRSSLSPMGHLLLAHSPAKTPHVLHMVGRMQACFEVSMQGTPVCRQVGSQLEIGWGDLHVVVPFKDGEMFVWFKQDMGGCLACLSHTIVVLFPSFSDLPRVPIEEKTDPRINDLYYTMLRSDGQFYDASIRFYFLLHGSGQRVVSALDVIDLPHFILYGAVTNQLDLMLQSLERIYQRSPFAPVLDAVSKRVASLEVTTSANYRQACIEGLLQCGDPQVVPQAWTGYQNEVQLPFLMDVGPGLDQNTLPSALNRVCSLVPSLEPGESFELLKRYLLVLQRQGGPICAAYQPTLVGALQHVLRINPSYWFKLFADPTILAAIPSPEPSLLDCLRQSIGNSAPDVWWGDFVSVRKFLQEKGTDEAFRPQLSAVLLDALLQSDLRSQEGFDEAYQTLSPAVSASASSSSSRAAHLKVIEESDVIDLPNILTRAVELQKLDAVLERLTLLYQGSKFAPLLEAIQRGIVALETKHASGCRQVCFEHLLTCENRVILASVWANLTGVEQVPLLLKIAPRLRAAALPFALERVCQLGLSLPPSECVRLFCVYYELPGADKTKMIALMKPHLEADRQLWLELLASPSVLSTFPNMETSLFWSLRASMKKSELSVWWAQFVSVQKFLQGRGAFESSRQELAKIFQAAHNRFDVTAQEGFAEVYQPLASEIADVSLGFAYFVQGTTCEVSDVTLLPDFIAYGVETQQLDSVLERLDRVYQKSRFAPLFAAVRSKIEALSDKTDASCRQACVETLLVCPESDVLASVWASSKRIQRLPFLADIAPTFTAAAFPFAIARVTEYYVSLPAADAVRLLCVYLDQMLQRKKTEEAAVLRGLLDPLLEAHPQQRFQLLSYPSIPVPVGSLEAAMGKSDASVWWNQFLTLRKTQGLALDGLFQKALKRLPAIRDQEGFAEVFNSIAERLFTQRDEAGLIAFLRILPTAAVVKPWYKALIERHLKEKTVISGEVLTDFIKSGAYRQVDRTVLVNLINDLVSRRNFSATLEVHTLAQAAALGAAELPPVLEYLLAYYASGVKDNAVLEDIRRNFSYFVTAGDARLAPAVHAVVSRLESVPRTDAQWGNVAVVLALMQNSDLFLEDSVKVLESLSGNPPVQCFGLMFPRVSRLSAEQKFRLARCYGVALGHLKSDNHRDEIIKALPNVGWLQGQLRKDESWEEFTRLFFHLHRGKVDFKDAKVLADAFWIAPRLLGSPTSSCFPEFEKFLLRCPTNVLDTAEWRPLITRFVDRNPDLITQADRNKKAFYEKCQTKVPKPAAVVPRQAATPIAVRRSEGRVLSRTEEEMLQRATIPPNIVLEEPDVLRAKIRAILTEKPLPFEMLGQVFVMLDILRGDEFELWELFFEALPEKKLLGEIPCIGELWTIGWHVWMNTHPIENFKPEHGMHWSKAVNCLLATSKGTNRLWVSFMLKDAMRLLEKMEPESCREFTGLCMEMGVIYCWHENTESVPAVVRVLQQICANPSLIPMLAHVNSMLNPDLQARLYLLFVHHPDAEVRQFGEGLFTGTIHALLAHGKAMDTPPNWILFGLYCDRPFVPSTAGSESCLQWIQGSWLLFRKELSWDQACRLVKTVFQFPFPPREEARTLLLLKVMHALWESLFEGFRLKQWKNVAALEKEHRHFQELTLMLMDRTVRDIQSSVDRVELLKALRTNFNQSKTFITEESKKIFRLRYARRVFGLTYDHPDACKAASLALDDLNAGLLDFSEETEEKQKCLITFTNALPALFNIESLDLAPKIANAFDSIMNVLWVINAGLEEEFCWFNLLFGLTETIRVVIPEKRHTVAWTAAQTYMKCSHPALVQKRNGAVPHKMLIDKSQTCFAFLLMIRTDPSCLTQEEWRTVVRGLPIDHLRGMIFGLNKTGLESKSVYLHSVAIARLIRHAKFADTFVDFCLSAVKSSVPPLIENAEDMIQIDCRIQWILALSSLGKRCRVRPVELMEKKSALAAELTEFAIDAVVSEASYQDVLEIFREIMNDDLDVAEAIFKAFNVAEDHPAEMRPKLDQLKAEIEKTIQRLRDKNNAS